MKDESIKLANGVMMPVFGAGTWQIPDDEVGGVVADALAVGYRHIDTAQGYENEAGVGMGIKNSGVARQDIFITTKINAEYKSYRSAKESIDESLRKLGTDYVDLMLIHSPRPFGEMFNPTGKTYYHENVQVYKALEEAYREGKIRAIGVSNFQIEDLDNLLNNCTIKPVMNQILVNITHYPKQLMDYCDRHQIVVGAYSPNATGRLKGEMLEEMAAKYNCTLPQLGNRFDYQLGCAVFPKTTHKEFMIQNLDIDFKITDEDMDKLKGIGQYVGWKGSNSE